MISCLCVTHERHDFMPWVEHQFLKQHGMKSMLGGRAELVIVDSSAAPWVSTLPFVRVIHAPACPGISVKRKLAMHEALYDYVTWFDDDDWQSPRKCLMAESEMYDRFFWFSTTGVYASGDARVCAIGAGHAYMFSCASGLASLYESGHEPIIFNSGVYRRSSVPQTFDESKITGEDTDWQERWLLSRPTYLTVGEPLHAWLCHDRNITNKSTSRFFDLPNPIPFDEWEIDFLRDLKKRRL